MLLLTSCVEQAKNRAGALFGVAPETAEEVPEEYKPVPPPAMEQDKIVQVTPKDKLMSLFGQFNASPDETLKGLVQVEFANNKSLFTPKLDEELAQAFTRAIPNVQQGEPITIQLLSQLYAGMLGENKEHLKGVLSRALDSAPALLADHMGRLGEDKPCNLAGVVPPEVIPESKRDFLLGRWQALSALKQGQGVTPVAMIYVNACLSSLSLLLGPESTPPADAPAPAEGEAVEPAAPAPQESNPAPSVTP